MSDLVLKNDAGTGTGSGSSVGAVANKSTSSVMAGLANLASQVTVGLKFLRFSGKDGRFSYKDGENEVDYDPFKMAINLLGVKHGYICWKDEEVVDELLISVGQALPDVADLEDYGPYEDANKEGWRFQLMVPMKDMETGDEFSFKTSAVSAVNSLKQLFKGINESAVLNDKNPEEFTPIVQVDVEKFKAKGFVNYKPVFVVTEWLDNSSLPKASASPVQEDDVEEEEEEVKPRRNIKAMTKSRR